MISNLLNKKGNICMETKKTALPISKRYLTGTTARIASFFRPRGLMSPYLGKRYSVEELFDNELDDSEKQKSIPQLKLVRAYEITPLIHATFSIAHENELPAALEKLLKLKLPNINLTACDDNWRVVFRKYLFFHQTLPAPMDTLTLQPMGIELYGRLKKLNGIDLDSPEGDEWMMKNRISFNLNNEVVGDMTLEVQAATYANVQFPGINVPLYL